MSKYVIRREFGKSEGWMYCLYIRDMDDGSLELYCVYTSLEDARREIVRLNEGGL